MKRGGVALLFFTAVSAFAGDGILSRYGTADRSAATEILIINGQAYTAPAGTAARIQHQQQEQAGAVNPRAGQYYPPAGAGVVNTNNGAVYPDVGGGYINPQTGEFIPK